MANEITGNIRFNLSKGALRLSKSFRISADMDGANYYSATVAVSDVEELLPLGSVAVAGWGWFVNTSDTEVIEVGGHGGSNFSPFHELQPGECCLGPLAPGHSFYAKCLTGYGTTGNLEYGVVER